jgi:putative phosphoribosyl transferase
MRFRNRPEGGCVIARILNRYSNRADVVVLALPRGGVPVAYEVASALNAPLDVFIVRKLGVPGQEELAMGAIASGGIRELNPSVIQELNIPLGVVEAVAARETEELYRREQMYRSGKPPLSVANRIVILVDDGLATGATMKAAVAALRRQDPKKIVVAVPTAPAEACEDLQREADEVICAMMPEPFYSVGRWYEDFDQTTDAEVSDLLRRSERAGSMVSVETRPISIPIGTNFIEGDFSIPAGTRSAILFAHGSGSSRHSPRNKHVAQILNRGGYATLLLDLLTTHEEIEDQRTAQFRFDIDLLASRLIAATDWLVAESGGEARHIGYFGASTGAAAALMAAAKRPELIEAVVSRGGRPDLAGPALGAVRAPTLLIVGEYDEVVLELNRRAAAELRSPHRIEIVPAATHLFEEPGALDHVASLAERWFDDYLEQRMDVA